jgi:molybdopterin-guanine dinucleotide biosynthesis protein A
MKTNSLVGAVLSGGKSTRMGTDKALLVHQQKTMLLSTLNILRKTSVEQIAVSVSNEVDYGDLLSNQKLTKVTDLFHNKGPLSAIYSLADAFPDSDILVLPVDLPLLNAQTVQTLIDAGQREACHSYFNQHFIPLYFNKTIQERSKLRDLFTQPEDACSNTQKTKQKRLSIKHFLSSSSSCIVPIENEETLLNANTPQEWSDIVSKVLE